MRGHRTTPHAVRLIQAWQLSSAATLGSAVRAKGILLELRAQLPYPSRKLLDVEAGQLVLRTAEGAHDDFSEILAILSEKLHGIEALPVIPREVEDILTITSGERHRWLKDGRLRSAGTRTVKLRGRARKITFHVFDPRHIEDVLDRDLVSIWREDDAVASAENRRRAAGKAALTRAGERLKKKAPRANQKAKGAAPQLDGWEEFDRKGLLR
jgi:hypothetical protein